VIFLFARFCACLHNMAWPIDLWFNGAFEWFGPSIRSHPISDQHAFLAIARHFEFMSELPKGGGWAEKRQIQRATGCHKWHNMYKFVKVIAVRRQWPGLRSWRWCWCPLLRLPRLFLPHAPCLMPQNSNRWPYLERHCDRDGWDPESRACFMSNCQPFIHYKTI